MNPLFPPLSSWERIEVRVLPYFPFPGRRESIFPTLHPNRSSHLPLTLSLSKDEGSNPPIPRRGGSPAARCSNPNNLCASPTTSPHPHSPVGGNPRRDVAAFIDSSPLRKQGPTAGRGGVPSLVPTKTPTHPPSHQTPLPTPNPKLAVTQLSAHPELVEGSSAPISRTRTFQNLAPILPTTALPQTKRPA